MQKGNDKYIFLDIDGPLCTWRSLWAAWADYFEIDYSKIDLLDQKQSEGLRKQILKLKAEKRAKGIKLPQMDMHEWPFDKEAVEALNMITDATGAKIVVSSSHRIGRTLEDLQKQIAKNGVKGEVVALTPSFRKDQLITPYRRGEEILAWISQETQPLQVGGLVIIDDDSKDIEPIWGDFFIHIYHGMDTGGMNPVHAQMAIKQLQVYPDIPRIRRNLVMNLPKALDADDSRRSFLK